MCVPIYPHPVRPSYHKTTPMLYSLLWYTQRRIVLEETKGKWEIKQGWIKRKGLIRAWGLTSSSPLTPPHLMVLNSLFAHLLPSSPISFISFFKTTPNFLNLFFSTPKTTLTPLPWPFNPPPEIKFIVYKMQFLCLFQDIVGLLSSRNLSLLWTFCHNTSHCFYNYLNS